MTHPVVPTLSDDPVTSDDLTGSAEPVTSSATPVPTPVPTPYSVYNDFTLLVNELTRTNREIVRLNEELNATIEQLTATQVQLIEARAVAEQANLAKSIFLSTMTHELRTPLNSILGFAELLHMTETNPKRAEQLSIINQAGHILLKLINSILDLSKLESGKVTLNNQVFDLNILFLSLNRLFAEQFTQKNLQLTFSSPSILVEGDYDRLQEIMINLVGNALKFTAQGGVRISCQQIQKDLSPSSNSVAVSSNSVAVSSNSVAVSSN